MRPAWRGFHFSVTATGCGEAFAAAPRAAETMASISSWLSTFSTLVSPFAKWFPGFRDFRPPSLPLGKPDAQSHQSHRVNLGNAGFAHPEHRSHLFHGEFFEVIEREHLPLPLRK